MNNLLGGAAISSFRENGAILQGREYLLPLSYRGEYLAEMAILARNLGMTFGFADNDLLLHSDGNSCCNAANLYLKDASFFEANFLSFLKSKNVNEKVFFSGVLERWLPKKPISPYLNSKARILGRNANQADWQMYLEKMWKGEYGIYSPDYFDGVVRLQEYDHFEMPVYKRIESSFGKLIGHN